MCVWKLGSSDQASAGGPSHPKRKLKIQQGSYSMLRYQDWIQGASWEGKKRLSWAWEAKYQSHSSKTWTWGRPAPPAASLASSRELLLLLYSPACSGHRQRAWFAKGTLSIRLSPSFMHRSDFPGMCGMGCSHISSQRPW